MVMKTMYLHRQMDFFHISHAFQPVYSNYSLAPQFGFLPSENSLFVSKVELWQSENENEVSQLCPTLCDPKDCSLPGSSIRSIFQARVLEWAAIYFSRGSSQPRDQTWVFPHCRQALYHLSHQGSLYQELWQKTLQNPEVSHCCNFFWTLNHEIYT